MVSGSLYAGQVSGMTTFTPGTTAYASEVNDNFTEHTTQINDNDTRITANATAIQTNATAIAESGLVRWTTLNVSCPASVSVTTTYAKIATIGSFTKAQDGTVLNVVFSGRLSASSMTGTGVIFELRIDDTATTSSRIRGSVKSAEIGASGVAVTMEGFFTNLSAGSHTVSMYARASSGGATGVQYDTGCWSTDSVIIKEFQ
ncbi:hypothetical protein LOH54_05440 [Sulfurimonas sp. HSL-3221]|uniref:hypothetical protein n=1 Tax=Sulfurimonadaceae TaxID=2771471 RepID=UPI001E45738E|nr:hypothetical protein [Sulfurimonas sp. HSL-3221]UFS63574.1 hypothetical protein LOH54_05440 [Sulfurimonas sp. HSL-3221]